MTALSPSVLRGALGALALPATTDESADALALALLPDLTSGERMGRVVHIRQYAEEHRQVEACQIDFERITPRRPEETMIEHFARAVDVSRERLAMAVDAAVGRQTEAAEQAERDGKYPAGLLMQPVMTP